MSGFCHVPASNIVYCVIQYDSKTKTKTVKFPGCTEKKMRQKKDLFCVFGTILDYFVVKKTLKSPVP